MQMPLLLQIAEPASQAFKCNRATMQSYACPASTLGDNRPSLCS